MSRTILLTRGYVAIVDDVDYERFVGLKWQAALRGTNVYAVTHSRDDAGKRQMHYMHRLVVSATSGTEVDHWNQDGLDNRRENLRVCTRAQNQANQRKTRGGSEYKGVSAIRGSWRATIKHDGKQRSLGYFRNEVDAARAYDAAAVKVFGEYASLNFPDELEESNKVVERHYAKRKRPVHLEAWQRRALVRAHQEVELTYSELARSFGINPQTAANICANGE